MNTYKTAEIAAMAGIHPNTVRLYEELKLIPRPERQSNGYRVFTDVHAAQLRLVRRAFHIEILQNGLRKKIIRMLQTAAAGNFDAARVLTEEYLTQIRQERTNAEEAVAIIKQILAEKTGGNGCFLKRKEVSLLLDISMDTLRNWEMNGLLTVKRRQNGYRVYTDDDVRQLKIIRTLRYANYSLEAILRMLSQVSRDPSADIQQALNTPREDADIISACDKLISSLSEAERSARELLLMLEDMKIRFQAAGQSPRFF